MGWLKKLFGMEDEPDRSEPARQAAPPPPPPAAPTQIPPMYFGVAGESYHGEVLKSLHDRGGAHTAELVREPDNEYDPNAVRVDIGGEEVGHIPKHQASGFHPALERLAREGRPALVSATVDWGDRGALEVTIEVPAEYFR